MQIEMSIKGLMVDPVTNMPIVILRDKDGQKVLLSGVTNLVARMPDRLLIEETSDRRERSYIYDGKQFTVYARLYAAQARVRKALARQAQESLP